MQIEIGHKLTRNTKCQDIQQTAPLDPAFVQVVI